MRPYAKALVAWATTAVGIARQASTLAIIAADPKPSKVGRCRFRV